MLKKRKSPSMYWSIGSLVAAACIAFVLIRVGTSVTPSERIWRVKAETVEELASFSQTTSKQEAVEKFLHDHELMVELRTELGMEAVHEPVDLLGAKKENVSGDSLIELLFACCEYPVKVIIVKRDSEVARLIGRAMDSKNEVQATRVINDKYFAAVIGKHPAHGLLDVFAHQHP